MAALMADTETKIQAIEYNCVRKLLQISYSESKTSVHLRNLVNRLARPQETQMVTMKRRKCLATSQNMAVFPKQSFMAQFRASEKQLV
ncbi:hypothetical protein ElyMa_005970000 [Elysia marginata]|uniref:ENT domain-containing protein n=1 Tax=Elysia marginata TaxID=1093978 RepID=A0AAV4GBT8_9GAST|nr:hypothetical protein ElyMa_005970000 [Elysia marginata]